MQFALNSLKTHAFASCATMCVQGSTSALMFVGDDVYVFDSHRRYKAGDLVSSGTAVIAINNTAHIYRKCGLHMKMYNLMLHLFYTPNTREKETELYRVFSTV